MRTLKEITLIFPYAVTIKEGMLGLSYVGPDERVLAEVSPHPLAFAGSMVLWVYAAVVSIATWMLYGNIVSWSQNVAYIGAAIAPVMPFIVQALLICIPFLVYSIAKVTWKYFVVAVILTVVIPVIYQFVLGLPPTYSMLTVAGFSVLAIILIDIHRRAHKYIITDRRIIIMYSGIFRKTRRDVVYSRISDLVLEKGFFGKIFNFGNIIPLSQSGMGLGEDLAALTAGVGAGKTVGAGIAVTGGRTVKVPRSRSFYMLYGVPRPEEIYNLMISSMKASEEAPYLREIVEKLDRRPS